MLLNTCRKTLNMNCFFGWLVDELRTRQSLCERTKIYCQTIKQPLRVCLGSICKLETILIQEMSLLKCFIPAHQLQISNISSTPSSQRMELFAFFLPPLLLAWEWIVKVFTESYTMDRQKKLKHMSPRNCASWQGWNPKPCIHFVSWNSLKSCWRRHQVCLKNWWL